MPASLKSLFRRFGIAAALVAICGLNVALAPAALATTLSGTIKVVCTIVTDASVANGSLISVEVDAVASSVRKDHRVSTSLPVTKSANSQTVTLNMPYLWTLTAHGQSVFVFLFVSRGTTLQNGAAVSTTLSIPLPADGATTTVHIPVRI